MIQNLITCRFLLKFAYIGTHYKGVQRLTRRVDGIVEEDGSIQTLVENALNRALLPVYPSRLALSSRTDAGVHALVNYANVDLTHPVGSTIYRPSFITSSVNYILHKNKHEITLLETRVIPSYFHSRKNAKSRSYIYRIAVPTVSTNTFNSSKSECLESFLPVSQLQRCHIVNASVNMDLLEKCLEMFLGEHDFESFCTTQSEPREARPTIRQIDRLELKKCHLKDDISSHIYSDSFTSKLEYYELFIKSKSFLYNQVRRMVSALLDVGMGNIKPEDITKMLQEGKTFRPQGLSNMVPPYGLYLVDVEYDHREFELHENFNEYSPKSTYRDDTFE